MRARPILGVCFTILIVAIAVPASAELRISSLSVYLNDQDVTVQTTVLGAIPASFTESIRSGIPSHVRFTVELWQHRPMWLDRLLQRRMVERQLLYASLAGETREPYVSRELRDAQRVLSELRGLKLMPAAQLDQSELFYVRVRAEAALSGQNTFLTRLSGAAEETPWMDSSLLTISRVQ
ncbi:MAG: hypothetical protein DMD82_07620 [Candidatus Rokuibacteriota bacterium]|nr:MAG: hypothetical protein DMD82_07620 [Candidatus Rokubacteria bacterium]